MGYIGWRDTCLLIEAMHTFILGDNFVLPEKIMLASGLLNDVLQSSLCSFLFPDALHKKT